MPLPSRWIDHLFAKLTVRYGESFVKQYPDLDPALVRADWADVLDGLEGAHLTHGLSLLPADKPPNALQFRALCKTFHVQRESLPAPVQEPMPEAVKDALRQIAATRGADLLTPAERCYENILAAAHRNHGKVSTAQRQQIDTMRRMGKLARYFPGEATA